MRAVHYNNRRKYLIINNNLPAIFRCSEVRCSCYSSAAKRCSQVGAQVPLLYSEYWNAQNLTALDWHQQPNGPTEPENIEALRPREIEFEGVDPVYRSV